MSRECITQDINKSPISIIPIIFFLHNKDVFYNFIFSLISLFFKKKKKKDKDAFSNKNASLGFHLVSHYLILIAH
jgi:hypothetical protein